MKRFKKLLPIAMTLALVVALLVPATALAQALTVSDSTAGVSAQYTFVTPTFGATDTDATAITITFPTEFTDDGGDLTGFTFVSAQWDSTALAGTLSKPTANTLLYTFDAAEDLSTDTLTLVVSGIDNPNLNVEDSYAITFEMTSTSATTGAIGSLTTTAPTSGVTATVTTGVVGLTVDPVSIAYGIMSLDQYSAVKTLSVVNTGTVTEDINILGADATFSTNTWTLTTAAGSEDYMHLWDKTGASPLLNKLSKTAYASLTTNLAMNASQTFYLQLHTPTATALYGQYSTSVTLQAVQS